MTSTGFELDQLAYGISWPVRALAAVARLVDPWLSNPVARRAVKASVDFWCAATAVVVAVAVGEGIATFGVTQTVALTLLVGLLLVVADGLGGAYRTIWRYTSLPDALTVSLSRSEEHTSELQSRENLVCRLLLEKKKQFNRSWRSRP